METGHQIAPTQPTAWPSLRERLPCTLTLGLSQDHDCLAWSPVCHFTGNRGVHRVLLHCCHCARLQQPYLSIVLAIPHSHPITGMGGPSLPPTKCSGSVVQRTLVLHLRAMRSKVGLRRTYSPSVVEPCRGGGGGVGTRHKAQGRWGGGGGGGGRALNTLCVVSGQLCGSLS